MRRCRGVEFFGPFEEFCIPEVSRHVRFEGEDNGGLFLFGVVLTALFQQLHRSIIKLEERVFLHVVCDGLKVVLYIVYLS